MKWLMIATIHDVQEVIEGSCESRSFNVQSRTQKSKYNLGTNQKVARPSEQTGNPNTPTSSVTTPMLNDPSPRNKFYQIPCHRLLPEYDIKKSTIVRNGVVIIKSKRATSSNEILNKETCIKSNPTKGASPTISSVTPKASSSAKDAKSKVTIFFCAQ